MPVGAVNGRRITVVCAVRPGGRFGGRMGESVSLGVFGGACESARMYVIWKAGDAVRILSLWWWRRWVR